FFISKLLGLVLTGKQSDTVFFGRRNFFIFVILFTHSYSSLKQMLKLRNMCNDELVENIKVLIEPVREKFRALIPDLEQQVDYIIRNNVRNNNEIEHILDFLLDANMMIDVEYLFEKLVDYYSGFSLKNANSYRKFYQEMVEDED